MPDRPCQRPGCDNQIPSRKRQDARWCSRKCEGRATRAAKRMGIGLADYGKGVSYSHVEYRSLAELHGKAGPPSWRDDPRNFSDYGDLPDDFDLAAEIDYDDGHQGGEDGRYHAILQEDADQCTPRETWKRWRSHGRRHGVEHPEATADRIDRHHAAEAARMARIDRSTGGRIQDRFDTRTSANVAQNAIQSRALNARHTEQPPVSSPAFDFTAEQVTGDFYRQGRPSGQRAGHADYSWKMEDGFRF